MKNLILTFCFCSVVFAQSFAPPSDHQWGISLEDLKKESDMKLRLGFRLQGAAAYSDVDRLELYLRRVRFQFEAKFFNDLKYYMDIRNDRVGYKDNGAGAFELGDAYLQKDINNISSIKVYRAKVDVSRVQTISSSNLLYQDRPAVTDYASNFINEARRATNIQMNNTLGRWYLHLIAGDGVTSEGLEDYRGESAADSKAQLESQGLMYGGKLRYSFLGDWSKSHLKSNFFGEGKHLELGLGVFSLDSIRFTNETSDQFEFDRQLTNVELSGHYYGINFMGEYFHFDGVVSDFGTSPSFSTGEGHYLQGEYMVPGSHNKWSVLTRYEDWQQSSDSRYLNRTFGSNYYFNGNKVKLGAFYENRFSSENSEEDIVKITSQIHY